MNKKSIFENYVDIIPSRIRPNMTVVDMLRFMGNTCFEARNIYQGGELFKSMVDAGDLIWLGIAGAGIAGGLGGAVISMVESGFIDVICSTGAQVYHDLHFAFGLPVKAINPNCDDDLLKKNDITRIYDIGIKNEYTLEAQDALIRQFVFERKNFFSEKELSSWEFNYQLGLWVNEIAPYPDRSFTAVSAKYGVPIFWDSLANHSIAMNLVRTDIEGFRVRLSPQKDIFESAAIIYNTKSSSFVELGGGGPKNFIQQTGPFLKQICEIDFQGAERGLQIGTAIERDGSLSGCTFKEAVTWGKYRSIDERKMVQIWGDYTVIFPLLCAYVLDLCETRNNKNIIFKLPEMVMRLTEVAQPS